MSVRHIMRTTNLGYGLLREYGNPRWQAVIKGVLFGFGYRIRMHRGLR